MINEQNPRKESTEKVNELAKTLEKVIEDIERKRDQERPHDFLSKETSEVTKEELLMKH